MKYEIGNIVTLKKKHVCGSYEWLILRTGAEIKMECVQCKRSIMILKKDLDKRIKSIKEES